MSKAWYTALFDTFYLTHLTDIPIERTSAEIEFIESRLNLAPEAAILDLCCGPGRHAIPLSMRGYRVTGQDLSQEYLERGRENASLAGEEIRWVCSDMRSIPFENEFDACLSWYSSFGYLESDSDDLKVLAAIFRALKPGGKLLIDLMSHAWFIQNHVAFNWRPTVDGVLILEELQFDLLAGRSRFTATAIFPSGERTSTEIQMRIYTLVELVKQLTEVGFNLKATWGEMDGSPYSLASRRMIILAEKLNL